MEFGELSDGYYELWWWGNAIRGGSRAVRIMLGGWAQRTKAVPFRSGYGVRDRGFLGWRFPVARIEGGGVASKPAPSKVTRVRHPADQDRLLAVRFCQFGSIDRFVYSTFVFA